MNERFGFSFPYSTEGEKEAYETALWYWWYIREEKNPIREIKLEKLNYLPGTTAIDWFGIVYHIHGIIHEGKVSKKVGKYFEKIFRRYSRSGLLVFEENLDRFFRLNKGSGIEYEVLNDHIVLGKMDPITSFKFECTRLYKTFKEWLGKFKRAILRKKNFVLTQLDNFLKDESYLLRVREIMERASLPEPLQISYTLKDSIDKHVILERSYYMLTELRDLAILNLTGRVHFICGYAHEPQIIYLIKAGF